MKTEIIKLNPENPDIYKIRHSAEILDSGGLVAFSTETVYGLACRVAKDSLARLDDIKDRDPNKHYTLHIGNKSQITRYVPTLSLREQKLIQNAWPGPLTIVFQLADSDFPKLRKNIDKIVIENLYSHNSIGVRCPDSAVAAALLSEAHSAVVAPSANYNQAEPPITAQQVIAVFDDVIEIILDAGPTKYKQSSTIAKIGNNGIEILRSGFYSHEQIVGFSTVNILFVCTGNTCRSPMAEGVCKKRLAEKLGCMVDQLTQMGYNISSAGTIGATGWPASSEAVSACRTDDIDISSHMSSAVTEDRIRNSDLIYVMSRHHAEQIIQICPDSKDKVLLLADEKEITDPIGQDEDFYRKCFAMIEQSVAKRIGELVL